MHYILTESDAIPTCSDACSRDYCEQAGIPYEGWNGCHDGPECVDDCVPYYPEYCAACGVRCNIGFASECVDDCVPFERNILPGNYAGEYCPHGHALAIDPAELEHAILEGSAR